MVISTQFTPLQSFKKGNLRKTSILNKDLPHPNPRKCLPQFSMSSRCEAGWWCPCVLYHLQLFLCERKLHRKLWELKSNKKVHENWDGQYFLQAPCQINTVIMKEKHNKSHKEMWNFLERFRHWSNQNSKAGLDNIAWCATASEDLSHRDVQCCQGCAKHTLGARDRYYLTQGG